MNYSDMKKIFSIDRTEGEIAVCISDDGDNILAPVESLMGMRARDVFSAETDGNTLLDITPLPEERDRRLREGRELFEKLLDKKNHH